MINFIKHPEANNTSSGLPLYEFQIDSDADVSALPTTIDKKMYAECVCAGSCAYTADMNSIYTLSPAGVWKKIGGDA